MSEFTFFSNLAIALCLGAMIVRDSLSVRGPDTASIENQTKNNILVEQVVSRMSLEKGVTVATWIAQTLETSS